MTKSARFNFRGTPAQDAKLQNMAAALGVKPSVVLRQLVENAELKMAPVAIQLVEENNRRDTRIAETTNVTAVEA